MNELKTALIVYETEEAARRRLARFGYDDERAREIAVYLAQSTDLPGFMPEISGAFARDGVEAKFVELDELLATLKTLDPESTIVWTMTDGVRFYRGSAAPAVARLAGFARFGSPPPAAHLCQDKFASLALAAAAGLTIPPTRLFEDGDEIAALGAVDAVSGPYFVKPNTLGAKIGIFSDSRVATLDEAREQARRLWARYRDRAVVQPFVAGDDVRVSFLDLGGGLSEQLGVQRLLKDVDSETGGAFMTMRDNETLSGARDTVGGRGGFGEAHAAAFTPKMIDLKRQTDARSRRAVADITQQVERLQRLVGLSGCFSCDFRIDDEGKPTFFEFEICPAVTIYDFNAYLASRGALTLGPALARAMRLAFARRRSMTEA